MTDIFDTIRNRRSVRRFKPDPVSDEHLELILDAARYAPSAGNNQPWSFLILRERSNLGRLYQKVEAWTRERMRAIEPDPMRQADRLDAALTHIESIFAAPVLICLFVDTGDHPEFAFYDGVLAAGHLMLAARSLGYGTSFQTTFFSEEVINEHFAVPAHLRLICTIPLGIPVEWPPMPQKKPLHELVCYETLGSN